MAHAAQPRRSRLAFAVLTVVALACGGLVFANAAPAQAANAEDFRPGNIISDANFYNGGAMTSSDVQSFMNTRVPRCTIGDPGYAPGSVRGNNVIAATCMRDFSMATSSKPANAYCGSYSGSSRESAAQIIAKVGVACGISQRVLLVMLEKEQSLVTDTWPFVRQFDVAMGYACPDSGPGNSANCDSAYYGFQNQVYRSAWQLKVYRAQPDSFRYKPFQMNSVQWHPNTGCGTSQVFIENWATAALYIYTPYRPNQAALAAQWGTGDSCSTYGNRNFFMFYSTWFGSPIGDAYPEISAKYSQNSWLGNPTTEYVTQTSNGGGTLRGFENGAITLAAGSSRAIVITGDFREYYNSKGGTSGSLGWPASDVASRPNGGRVQGFQNAAVTHLASTGFVQLSGIIRDHYNAAALGLDGPLGWPTADAVCASAMTCTQQFETGNIKLENGKATTLVPAITELANAERATLGSATTALRPLTAHGGGFVQAFHDGAIAWSAEYGAFTLTGALRQGFNARGGVDGPLGWPTSPAVCDSAGSCQQRFVGGLLSTSPTGGVTSMSFEILTAFEGLGGAGGPLGPSTGSTNPIPSGAGGSAHGFRNGAIAASPRTGAFAVMAPIRDRFNSAGGLGGILGWPTGSSSNQPGGTVQGFEGGAITSSAAGTYLLTSPLREKFAAAGGLNGTLGWPTSDRVALSTQNGAGAVQTFQGGALTLRAGADTSFGITGEIRSVFNAAGGIGGTPGWPTSDPVSFAANGGGFVQAFQNAAITSSPAGTYLLSGSMRAYYNREGGVNGRMGWPTTSMSCVGVECSQGFQGGTMIWNSETSVGRVE